MADFAQVDMFIRLAAVPEMDPVQDKVLFKTVARRTDGYAREDDRIILDAGIPFIPEFDAFQDETWIDLGVTNEGAAVAIVILSDGVVPAYRQRLEPAQSILIRHFKGAASAPVFTSVLGTKLRMWSWGEPFDGR